MIGGNVDSSVIRFEGFLTALGKMIVLLGRPEVGTQQIET